MSSQFRVRLLFYVLVAMAVPAATANAGTYLGLLGDNECKFYLASTGQKVYFCDADIRPTGTGVFDPFLRVGKDGTNGNPDDTTPDTYSSGWNTDATHQDGVDGFNDYDKAWTSALPIGEVALGEKPNVAGVTGNYALFTVDINQQKNEGSDILTLNQMLLYNCSDNDPITIAAGCTTPEFFNLFGGTGDFINFDYTLHTGSGSGDVDVYIENKPNTFLGPYITLLDGWGCGNSKAIPDAYKCNVKEIVGDNDGFQEWAATGGKNPPVIPEPASLLLLGSGLSAAGVAVRRRRQAKTPKV